MTPEHVYVAVSYGTESSDWRRAEASIELVPLLWNTHSCDCLLWVIMRTYAVLNVTTEQCIQSTVWCHLACTGGLELASLRSYSLCGMFGEHSGVSCCRHQSVVAFHYRHLSLQQMSSLGLFNLTPPAIKIHACSGNTEQVLLLCLSLVLL